MHLPPAFREEDLGVLHALIRAHPLATLVSQGPSGLVANLVPFSLDPEPGKGVLRAHLSRANAQLAALEAGGEALVIFQGPEAYVTPSWHATKAEHGKVVPTWNYVMVQARGVARLVDDPAWLRAQLCDLTDQQEGARAEPWRITDAPTDFIVRRMRDIRGVEIPINAIEGKWKTSQNQTPADRAGVAEGLRHEGAADMAALVARPT